MYAHKELSSHIYIMFQYEPVLHPGNEHYVHHMLLYECVAPHQLASPDSMFQRFVEHPGESCYSSAMPSEWDQCITPIVAWAVGSQGTVWHLGPETVFTSCMSAKFVFTANIITLWLSQSPSSFLAYLPCAKLKGSSPQNISRDLFVSVVKRLTKALRHASCWITKGWNLQHFTISLELETFESFFNQECSDTSWYVTCLSNSFRDKTSTLRAIRVCCYYAFILHIETFKNKKYKFGWTVCVFIWS